MSSKAPDLAGNVIAEGLVGWGDDLRKEFSENAFNLNVGSTLLSVTSKVKVWHILIAPGGRLQAHRHIHDYFWTALRAGRSIQHTDDGVTRTVECTAGETRHFGGFNWWSQRVP